MDRTPCLCYISKITDFFFQLLTRFKPEVFGKVYIPGASFVGIRDGYVWPTAIRMNERKDFDVFAVVGKHDIDNTFCNWYFGNLQVGSALNYRDYNFRIYLSEAGHSGAVFFYAMPEGFRWLFSGTECEAKNLELYDFNQQIPME